MLYLALMMYLHSEKEMKDLKCFLPIKIKIKISRAIFPAGNGFAIRLVPSLIGPCVRLRVGSKFERRCAKLVKKGVM